MTGRPKLAAAVRPKILPRILPYVDQLSLLPELEKSFGYWRVSNAFDPYAASLSDRHYSRRTVGSPQFMPPGNKIVLVGRGAVFGWWRPDPGAGIVPMNGLDGWTCTIFRNESSGVRSSQLILEAELALQATAADCGPDGMITYVWDSKVKSSNPGYCFKCAGWRVNKGGRSVDGKKTLLQKPFALAGVSP